MSVSNISTSSRPRFYYGWIILALSTLCIFFSVGTRSLYAVFYLAQVQEFGWSRGAGSLAYTVNLLVFFAGLPLLGALLDRWGSRVVFSLASVFIAAGLTLGVFVYEAWHFIVTFGVITGIGFVANSQPLHGSVLAKWFANSERPDHGHRHIRRRDCPGHHESPAPENDWHLGLAPPLSGPGGRYASSHAVYCVFLP